MSLAWLNMGKADPASLEAESLAKRSRSKQEMLHPEAGRADSTNSQSPTSSQEHPRKKQRLEANSRPGLRWGAVFNLLILALAVAFGTYWFADDQRAPDFLRQYGVVGNLSAAASTTQNAMLSVPISMALRRTIRLNEASQSEAASHGAINAALRLLQDNSTFNQGEGAELLKQMIRNNTAVKDVVLSRKYGLLEQLAQALEAPSSVPLSNIAEILAALGADDNSRRKRRIAASGLVEVLLETVKDHLGANQATSLWAVANLLADSSHIQAVALQQDLPKTLEVLLQKPEGDKIRQPAIFASGNFAARHPAGQNALSEAGVLDALVRIIKAGVKSTTLQNKAPLHTKLLQHLSEAQRSDAAVRSALSEVGGLEGLLEIVETGTTERNSEAISDNKDSQLIAVEDLGDEEGSRDSVRAAVRDLQDEADAESGLLPDLNLSLLKRSPSGARVLDKLDNSLLEGSVLRELFGKDHRDAGDAAWALSMLVSGNAANQNQARQAGALEDLVKLLESTRNSAVSKYALRAISSLVKDNPENKEVIRNVNGVQGLVRLLASNPADKEVLQATAEALKFMATEKPAYETLTKSGFRWLRVLSRQLSALVLTYTGVALSPSASLSIVATFSSSLLILVLTLGIAKARGPMAYEG